MRIRQLEYIFARTKVAPGRNFALKTYRLEDNSNFPGAISFAESVDE